MDEQKKCPFCAESVLADAIKCKHCGEFFTPNQNNAASQITVNVASDSSKGIAAVLNFLIPGLGHLYQGRLLGSIVWFALVVFFYIYSIFPGLLLHFACILSSLSYQRKRKVSVTTSHVEKPQKSAS